MDDIDAQLTAGSTSVAPPTPIQPKSPPMPEFSGPHVDLQRRLHSLRRSNPPHELIQTTRDMSEASEALNEEVQRMNRENTANISNVSQIERNEVNIGSNILKIMRVHQVEEIQNAADSAVDAVEQVQLTMERLNEMLGRHTQPSDDTIRRLEEIKLSMQAAANISQADGSGATAAGELVDKLDDISRIHENMAVRLVDIEPTTKDDAVVLNELRVKSFEMAKMARSASKNLDRALEKGSERTINITYNTAMSVDKLLELSLSGEEYTSRIEDLTPDVRKVVEIERKVHEQRLKETVEKQFSKATSTPLVARHLKFDSDDDDDDLIDVDAQDFGDVADEEELQKTLGTFSRKSHRKSQIVDIDDNEESLFDISDGLVSDINKSIEEIEQNILPELESNQNQAESAEEQAIFGEAIEALQSHVATLDQCLDTVGEINQSLVAGAVVGDDGIE